VSLSRTRGWQPDAAGRAPRSEQNVILDGVGMVFATIGLSPADHDPCMDLDPVNGSVAVRISLAGPAMTGKGFETEAMRLTLDHAFTTVGVHRVHLDVYAFNTAAIKTYERLGFIHEGRLREALLWDGNCHDALLMSMLRLEWDVAG
jgi:RimJ/RimL family protein N-acetyltransferase